MSDYMFVLVHKDLGADNTYIQFKGTYTKAWRAFKSLSFALTSSPFCEIKFFSGNNLINRSFLKGAF